MIFFQKLQSDPPLQLSTKEYQITSSFQGFLFILNEIKCKTYLWLALQKSQFPEIIQTSPVSLNNYAIIEGNEFGGLTLTVSTSGVLAL